MDLEPVSSAYARREVLRAGLRAIGIVVAYFVLPFAHNWFVAALLLGFVLIGLFPFAAKRFRRVLHSEHPVGDAVSALMISLVTLVVSFAACYHVLSERNPAAMHGMATKLDALYFEVTTVATVGYGDITAVTQGARALVTINMLMGAVYIGTSLRVLTWTIQRHALPRGDRN
jgi:voltage-gated potassium channel